MPEVTGTASLEAGHPAVRRWLKCKPSKILWDGTRPLKSSGLILLYHSGESQGPERGSDLSKSNVKPDVESTPLD